MILSDLEEENRELRRRIVELGELVLDAGERSLRGRVAPFEGQSVVLHERTWARVVAGAVQAIQETGEVRLGSDGTGTNGTGVERTAIDKMAADVAVNICWRRLAALATAQAELDDAFDADEREDRSAERTRARRRSGEAAAGADEGGA